MEAAEILLLNVYNLSSALLTNLINALVNQQSALQQETNALYQLQRVAGTLNHFVTMVNAQINASQAHNIK